jgi:hypothetical protein
MAKDDTTTYVLIAAAAGAAYLFRAQLTAIFDSLTGTAAADTTGDPTAAEQAVLNANSLAATLNSIYTPPTPPLTVNAPAAPAPTSKSAAPSTVAPAGVTTPITAAAAPAPAAAPRPVYVSCPQAGQLWNGIFCYSDPAAAALVANAPPPAAGGFNATGASLATLLQGNVELQAERDAYALAHPGLSGIDQDPRLRTLYVRQRNWNQ